jgi:predicted Fe-Mo cluster-binding NifX family protein
MRIAVPYWQGRISPVFDVARNMLLVDVHNGLELQRNKIQLVQKDVLARSKRVSQLGVDVLICCAISRLSELTLSSLGMKVIAHICGPVEDVIKAFLSNRLAENSFLMAGCRDR